MDSVWNPLPTVAIRFCSGRQGNGRCTGEVTTTLGTVELCDDHLDEVIGALRDHPAFVPPADPRTHGTNGRPIVPAVVYYMGDPDTKRVKIGTTTQIRHRFLALAPTHRKVVLLATEPGGYALERSRHRQFKSLCAHGEWFRKAPILMEHIGAVRLEHDLLETGDGAVPAWGIAPVMRSSSR